jgi:RNA polymerase sigma factor (TIGR02999 family)
MPPPAPRDVTTLLGLLGQNDHQVENELFRLVEAELRRTAEAFLARGRPLHDLQPTLLIDDAFRELAGAANIHWNDRCHFYRLASRVMRQLIISAVRRAGADRRGGGQPLVPLEQAAEPIDRKHLEADRVVELHEALTRLESTDPELAEIVQLHHFGGLTFDQVAEVLSLSLSTVKRHWKMALAFLHRELEPGEPPAPRRA